MRKVIKWGDKMPTGYGSAWHNPLSHTVIAYPVPLNWIFRLARDAWFFIKFGTYHLPTTYGAAYEAGYKQCLKDCNHGD